MGGILSQGLLHEVLDCDNHIIMDSLVNIFKGIVAIGVVVLLVAFGVTIFTFLLGLACVAGAIFWLKKLLSPTAPAYSTSQNTEEFSTSMTRDDYSSAIIIEGVAEDVTADASAQKVRN
jgi:hypothetical protein